MPSNVSPTKLVAGLLAVNLLAGWLWSPATAPHRVRVVGAPVADQGLLTNALQKYADVPSRQIGAQHIAWHLAGDRSISSVDCQFNVFGRGVVTIRPRTPVAVIEGGATAMDVHGVVFSFTGDRKGIPTLKLDPALLAPNSSVLDSWPSQAVAGLIDRVQKWNPEGEWAFQFDVRSTCSFKGRDRARILLGTVTDLDKKWSRFIEEWNRDPKLLEKSSEVNLSSPTDIVVKP